MAKRKLTHRQRRQTEQQQQQRLKRAEQSPVEDSNAQLGPEQQGLVVARYGKTIDVEGDNGDVVRCKLRQNIGELVCGDQVIWQLANDGTGVIIAMIPRQSVLARPDFQGRIKLIAANIDQIMITCAIEPELSTGLIDRYLVAAETTGISPVIVINKIDLLSEQQRIELDEKIAIYQQLGYKIIHTSAKIQHGLDELIAQLKGRTSIFVGHSGVGKSSLVQELFPEQEIKIGDLSEATGKGTHTTTVATLYHLAHGGDLIDSPGIREFGLWDVTPEQAAEGFIELRPFLSECKFRNCQHQNEPGCAVRQAAEDGKITEQRLNSYYRIVESIAEK
jgi:ribosome biogenesis GTPase